jgi:3-phenylpropionate/trans-cinnamate dioxygenase alpha subunit
MTDYSHLVDLEKRTVSPKVFADEDVYRVEQEKVFGRCWLYIGHECQLENPGDFLSTYMGEEPVIFVRDRNGKLRVFLNSCRHRGVKVCRVDSGNTKVFTCPYHGWSYSTDGSLQGVPQQRTAYHNELDKSQWGLIEVPRVESHAGLVFACFDPEAQSLADYLGGMAWYLDLILRRSKAGTVVIPGVHRWRLGGNWKLAAEQFGGDNYHADALHRSMNQIGLGPEGEYRGESPWERDFEVKCEHGHGWINFDVPMGELPPVQAKFMERIQREAEETLSPDQARLVNMVQVGTIFPNFSIIGFLGFTSIRIWNPRGPRDMEVWSYGLIEKEAPPEVVEITRKMQVLTFGPSGIFEQDDGCVWGEAVEVMGGRQRGEYPLNYQMGAGHGREVPGRPGLVHPPSTELSVFGLHEYWRELMGRP